MKIHELKCWPEYFSAVHARLKNFELRKDDRPYKVGDDLRLREWEPLHTSGDGYTGRETVRRIIYILRDADGFGLQKGYCILALE